jgi:TfoX/Sxy family transcriptional regulator of competence genes
VAVNEPLVDRIRAVLAAHEITAREQRMFGGIAFMVDDRFAVGTMKEDIVVRVGKEAAERALFQPGVRPMDFTGRPMPGWIYVSIAVLGEDPDLAEWVRMGVAYSATHEPSKKSRKASQAASVHPRQPPGTRRV